MFIFTSHVRNMFLGHFGAALAAKRLAPATSLGTLVLGAQFLDLLWPLLLLAGYERVSIEPGLMAASSLDFTHYPISHSLLTAAAWGLLVGAGYYGLRRNGTGALVVGALVLSHWFLDLPMHRPDLPLWPGSATQVGAGIWNSVPATLVIEFGVLAAGLLVYLRSTRARDRIGKWALAGMVGLVSLFFLSGVFGPPPPGVQALAVGGIALWLLVPWGHWIDRHRQSSTGQPASGRTGASAP